MLCDICGKDAYRRGECAYPMSYAVESGGMVLICLDCCSSHAGELAPYNGPLSHLPAELLRSLRKAEGNDAD